MELRNKTFRVELHSLSGTGTAAQANSISGTISVTVVKFIQMVIYKLKGKESCHTIVELNILD